MSATRIRPLGFNVIGHLSDNLGIGVAARLVVSLIEKRGFPIALLDVPTGRNSALTEGERDRFAARSAADLASLPYAINLFVVGVDRLRRLQELHADRFERPDMLSAAICFWELPTLPPRWIPHLERLDVLVAASDFTRYAFEFALSGPTSIAARLPIDLPADVVADRARFGIADDAVAFVTSFEPYSDVVRKNVAGVIEAFRQGSHNAARATLIVKVNNALDEHGHEHVAIAALRKQCGADERVRIVTEPMTYPEVLSLYASADVFISLHRAEGLGLGMAEAMMLGKPVIATDWSGNLTFMTHGSSCLVRTRLVPVRGSTHIYSEAELEDTTRWAEPDLDHAARWVELLIERPELRKRIGAAAAHRMAAYNAEAQQGRFLDELVDLWRSGTELRMPRRNGASDDANEGHAVHSRLARIQELERELNWIKGRPSYRLFSLIKSRLRSWPPTRVHGR